MDKLEALYANIGTMEKLYGDIYGIIESDGAVEEGEEKDLEV